MLVATAAKAGKVRLKVAVGNMSAADFTAALTLALACENVAFTTYSIMLLVRSRGEWPTICDISETLNLSYHCIVHQVERTPYFDFDRSGRAVRVVLNTEGMAKTDRVAKRLTRKATA